MSSGRRRPTAKAQVLGDVPMLEVVGSGSGDVEAGTGHYEAPLAVVEDGFVGQFDESAPQDMPDHSHNHFYLRQQHLFDFEESSAVSGREEGNRYSAGVGGGWWV